MLPQFVNTHEPQPFSGRLELSAIFMLSTFAGAFVALGAKLALADR